MKTGDRENKDPSLTLRLTGDSRTTEQEMIQAALLMTVKDMAWENRRGH
jgi:hypothetical protein